MHWRNPAKSWSIDSILYLAISRADLAGYKDRRHFKLSIRQSICNYNKQSSNKKQPSQTFNSSASNVDANTRQIHDSCRAASESSIDRPDRITMSAPNHSLSDMLLLQDRVQDGSLTSLRNETSDLRSGTLVNANGRYSFYAATPANTAKCVACSCNRGECLCGLVPSGLNV